MKLRIFSSLLIVVLVLSLASEAYADLVSHYTFDTDASDAQGLRNGTLTPGGGTAQITHVSANVKVGTGALNVGGGGYVDLPGGVAQLNNLTQVTVAAWVNVHSDNNFVEGIFTTDTCCNDTTSLHIYWYETYLSGGPHLDGQSWGGGYVSSTAPGSPPTGWFHFAYVRDNSKLTIYINGVPTATAFGGTQANLGVDAAIGSWGGNERFFNGQIDDLRIYDHALTPMEIGSLPGVNAPLPPTQIEGDINRDDCVNMTDLIELAERWLTVGCTYPRWCEGTDIDESGFVDFTDFSFISGNWGKCFVELHNLGFVVVSPQGPADGGDFGKYTPGTATAGFQEAIDYAVANNRDVYIYGGGMPGVFEPPVIYQLYNSLHIPPAENLRIMGGYYLMGISNPDPNTDCIVFDSQKNSEFDLGCITANVNDGASVIKIKPQNPRPDGRIGFSNCSFSVSFLVGTGSVWGQGVIGHGTAWAFDGSTGPIENSHFTTMEINACDTGFILEQGDIRNNVFECPFDHITNNMLVVNSGMYNKFVILLNPGGVGGDVIGANINGGEQNIYTLAFEGWGSETAIIWGSTAKDNLVYAMGLPVNRVINNAGETTGTNKIVTLGTVGFSVSTPPFPASGEYIRNRSSLPVVATIESPGNVSGWEFWSGYWDYIGINAGLRRGQEIYLEPGDWLLFNYTSAPAWNWRAVR